MSSTKTGKNNPWFRWTNWHSHFDTFPIQVPTKLLRTVSPTIIQQPLDLQCLLLNFAMYVVEDVSTRLDILTQAFWAIGSVLQSYLSESRHYITCLSVTIWQSGKDIHYFCCGHLWRRRALLSKDCIGSRAVFKNVTSEYDSTFMLMKFCSNSALLTCQMSINVAEWTFCLSALPEWPPFCS